MFCQSTVLPGHLQSELDNQQVPDSTSAVPWPGLAWLHLLVLPRRSVFQRGKMGNHLPRSHCGMLLSSHRESILKVNLMVHLPPELPRGCIFDSRPGTDTASKRNISPAAQALSWLTQSVMPAAVLCTLPGTGSRPHGLQWP